MSTDTLKIINTSTKILGLILITTIAPLLLGILLIVVGVSADVVKLLVSLLGPLSLWSCMWYAYHLESKFPNQISNRVLNKLTLGWF
ncbi:MAG: hypothetical protein HWD59_11605 [Coxiellaceae bacterium]|nr:MAG: hypothetical protein HWD59_11605 [Coxiellaceae bacterium]